MKESENLTSFSATHKAKAYGFIPVWIDDRGDMPNVMPVNRLADILLTITDFFVGTFCINGAPFKIIEEYNPPKLIKTWGQNDDRD